MDQPGDELQADHHLQHSKKPPVPLRGVRRKTWNQKDDTTTIQTSPVASSLRKTRSEVMSKSLVTVGDGKAGSTSPRLLRKVRSTPPARSELVSKLSNECATGIQKSTISNTGKEASESVETRFAKMAILIEKDISGSDECCQEKRLVSSSMDRNECVDTVDDLEEEENEEDDVKVVADEKAIEEVEVIEVEKKSYDVKEVCVPDNKLSNITIQDDKNVDGEVHQMSDKKALIVQSALAVKQPPRYIKRSAFYSDFDKHSHNLTKASTNIAKTSPKPGLKSTKLSPRITAPAASTPQPNEFQRHSVSGDRLQSLVDLVMWRDVSRSAFVFGTGIFMIISSSYTQDFNISFVSVTSYLGLSYLALIFLFRSILRRGVIHVDSDIVVGEEEAIWIVKLVLPYVNEFFLILRFLFSGDPATTMKLAVLLFVLARCGSTITIWKMAKLGFIGVFTVPKVVTLYSLQLKTQCKFWMGRFKDAWDTCSHKKIIAGIIFSLIWNLCSVVARIWALFMVAVAFRYYQQLMAGDEEWEDDDVEDVLQKKER